MTTLSSEFPDETDPIGEDEHKVPNDYVDYDRSLRKATSSLLNSTMLSKDHYYDSARSNASPQHISSRHQRYQDRSLSLDDSGKNLDILVVWSRDSECKVSNLSRECQTSNITEANMRSMIKLAVAETNAAYQLSGVDTELVLVHAYRQPTYVELRNYGLSQILYELTGRNDGFIDEVHGKRESYGADIVAMIVDIDRYCGTGWIGPRKDLMFSVINWSCATGSFSFGHEIGHNLGLQHDRGTKNECSNSGYNYGYRDPDAAFRTIMAYNCEPGQCDGNSCGGCPRIQRFSNPNILYQDKPVGVVERVDSVRHINNVKAKVAKYFPHTTLLPDDELQFKGMGGCTFDKKCDVCTGDCDDDSECVGDLICFHRSAGDEGVVPGCSWGDNVDDIKTSEVDFCK